MSVSINKDTRIYCSFSKKAGNRGCQFFNRVFAEHDVNAIYKSFSVDDIHAAFAAAKALKFSGCAVAMPYKKVVYGLVDRLDKTAIKSQSVNTVVFNYDTNIHVGYSTDYYGAKKLLTSYRNTFGTICILGNGGLSGAVQAASSDLGFEIRLFTRTNWKVDEIRNSLVYNCTPLTLSLDESNCYIDCLIGTAGGDLLNTYQAHKQFELYTGITINDNT